MCNLLVYRLPDISHFLLRKKNTKFHFMDTIIFRDTMKACFVNVIHCSRLRLGVGYFMFTSVFL